MKCNKAKIQDNYKEQLDRTYSCFDDAESVVVRVTDTCACTYPANPYSNKRWCCNDMVSEDLQVAALTCPDPHVHLP